MAWGNTIRFITRETNPPTPAKIEAPAAVLSRSRRHGQEDGNAPSGPPPTRAMTVCGLATPHLPLTILAGEGQLDPGAVARVRGVKADDCLQHPGCLLRRV